MRLFAGLAATALLLAACGGAPVAASPTPTLSPSPTPQTKFVFNADLKSSNEVPAIADAEASCSGKGVFTLNTTKDTSGKITAATAQFDLTITGCPANTEIILFHIHKQVAGQNGSVLIDSGQKPTESIVLATGSTTSPVTKSNITVKPEDAEAIIATPSGFYFNVHSKVHGGGVIRDQLKLGS
jgi:hypothetical protein